MKRLFNSKVSCDPQVENHSSREFRPSFFFVFSLSSTGGVTMHMRPLVSKGFTHSPRVTSCQIQMSSHLWVPNRNQTLHSLAEMLRLGVSENRMTGASYADPMSSLVVLEQPVPYAVE